MVLMMTLMSLMQLVMTLLEIMTATLSIPVVTAPTGSRVGLGQGPRPKWNQDVPYVISQPNCTRPTTWPLNTSEIGWLKSYPKRNLLHVRNAKNMKPKPELICGRIIWENISIAKSGPTNFWAEHPQVHHRRRRLLPAMPNNRPPRHLAEVQEYRTQIVMDFTPWL